MISRFPVLIVFGLVLAFALGCPANLRAFALASTTSTSEMPGDGAEEPPKFIATADFNRDGIADVAKIVSPDGKSDAQSTVEILLGQKDGTFTASANLTVPIPEPRSIATGDFNGDGNPDLLIGDREGIIDDLLGDGKGNLEFSGEIAHVGSAVSIAVGDFNRDGILDLAVSDFDGNAATILLGSGHNTFRPVWSFALPQRGTRYHLATADFNRDGLSDLVITGGEESSFIVMLGNGNGTFTYAPELSNIRDPSSYCPT